MKCIRDIMTREVRHVAPNATLRQAAREMRDHSIGCLPVLDGETIVGLITDRDIVLRSVAEGREPERVTAEEAMTPHPVTVHQDVTVGDAAEIMKRRAIRRLIATDDENRPVGIVSLGDLAAAREDAETADAAEEVFHSPCCAAAH